MTNGEMNTFIAEKVHGWHKERIEFGVGKRWIWFDASGEKQISVRSYSPATNVAQAIEAAKVWRGQDAASRSWVVRSPCDGIEAFYVATLGILTTAKCAGAETPALAICDALVKAVSDDLAR